MNLSWIKTVYLYLVSLISLIILVIAAIMLINMGLKTWIFTKADSNIYYSPKIDCSDEKMKSLPECLDPNWEQKQQQAEKDSRSAQKQRDAAQAIAMILVATPVFLYHWKLTRKEA